MVVQERCCAFELYDNDYDNNNSVKMTNFRSEILRLSQSRTRKLPNDNHKSINNACFCSLYVDVGTGYIINRINWRRHCALSWHHLGF